MLVANSSIKSGGSLHYTHFYNHICILLVLFVLLIKYQNHFESHDARRKDFRNKVLNPVHDWFLNGHHGKWYFPCSFPVISDTKMCSTLISACHLLSRKLDFFFSFFFLFSPYFICQK